MRAIRALPLALSAALLLALCLQAADDKDKDKDKEKPKANAAGTLTLTDSKGKVNKVTDWKWLTGTRRLAWLAAGDEREGKDEKPKKGKPSVGPEAFAFREETTINFAAGVVTLIPLDRLRKLEVDADKKLLTVVAAGDKEDVTLEGTTKYTNINWFSLEADVDLGGNGVASFKYQGGGMKGNVTSVAFPAAKVAAIKGGRAAVVETIDKNVKKKHKVSDLMPLYTVNGGREKTIGVLMFKKTLKLDVAKLKSIVDATEDSDDLTWRVAEKDNEERTLTLLEKGTIDKDPVHLIGLVGVDRTGVGYKIFPLRRIAAVHFDVSELPADNELPPPMEEKEK